MPRLINATEHKKRKEASALRCLNSEGKPLNDASKSVAVQDKRDSCDINRIVKKALRPDGQVDASLVQSLAKTPGRFGDFTNAVDFQTLQNRVIRVRDAFMALPGDVRARFDNEPAKLIDFLSDPKNKKQAVEWGILPKPVIKSKKEETPEGTFWVVYEDGVEKNRHKVEAKAAAAAPAA